MEYSITPENRRKSIYLLSGLLILVVIMAYFLINFLYTGNSIRTEKETIELGAIIPLTGTSADAGEFITRGLSLALDDLKDSDFNYRLIYEDSQYDPKIAVDALNKLIGVDNIKFVTDYASSITLALAPIAEKNKILLIDPASQADTITHAGDYIFRTQTNTMQEAEFFSKFITKKIGNSRIALLAVNTDYGQSVIEDYSKKIKEFGGQVGLIQKFDAKTTDFRTFLTKASEDKSNYILIAGNAKHSAPIIVQTKELGLDFGFFATSTSVERAEFLSMAGEAGEGIIYAYPYDSSSKDKAQQYYSKKYNQKYNSTNEMISANAYDVLMLINFCAEKTKSTDQTKIKNCLYTVKDYDGASGVISFDKNGDVEKPMIIKTVRNGKFVKVQ
jgi:branched-chain amino acid transport system substrate-binding protein